MQNNFLLDMDGVLSDFTSGTLHLLNKELKRDISTEEYVDKHYGWSIQEAYNITDSEFWSFIEQEPLFWLDLRPFPWAKELVDFLRLMGDVTIVTSPSLDPDCVKQKLQWLRRHLNIESNDVFLGSKKYLMAGNGILIDDFPKNVEKFQYHGGKAILVPSNWNTNNLTFEEVKQTILNNL